MDQDQERDEGTGPIEEVVAFVEALERGNDAALDPLWRRADEDHWLRADFDALACLEITRRLCGDVPAPPWTEDLN